MPCLLLGEFRQERLQFAIVSRNLYTCRLQHPTLLESCGRFSSSEVRDIESLSTVLTAIDNHTAGARSARSTISCGQLGA